MEFINFLIDNYNIPILTAFLLGILTSISPALWPPTLPLLPIFPKKLKIPKTPCLMAYITLWAGA